MPKGIVVCLSCAVNGVIPALNSTIEMTDHLEANPDHIIIPHALTGGN